MGAKNEHQMGRHREERRRQRQRAAVLRYAVEPLERRMLLSDVIAWPAGPEFRANSFTVGSQYDSATAMDAAGNFVIAWTSPDQDGSGSGIYAQRYNTAGTPQGGEFRVNDVTANNQAYPSVAMDDDGDFVIAWQSYNLEPIDTSYGHYYWERPDIHARRYDSAGVAQGDEFQVNTTTTASQTVPSVAMDATGGFVIAWANAAGSDVVARRYDASGAAQGDEFRVNTTTAQLQTNPAVAMDDDGDFVVAWQSGVYGYYQSEFDIYAQRFDAAGAAQGTEFHVDGDPYASQRDPAVAMDADGDFVIAWVNSIQYADDVYARLYSAAGAAQGTRFAVASISAPSTISVAMDDDDGEAVFAWQNGWYDQSDTYVRRFSALGVADGTEFRANTTTAGAQGDPAVAMNAHGDLVVTWFGAGAGDSYGIFAQRYQGLAADEAAHVGDRVWKDLDGDGVQDAGEPGLRDVRVELYKSSGMFVAATTTDIDGGYHFDVMPGDAAYLCFLTPSGYIATKQDQGSDSADSDADRVTGRTPSFTLGSAGDVNGAVDAGFLLPGALIGAVFNDRNGNGLFEAGEERLQSFEVWLDLDNDGVRDAGEPTSTTSPGGTYQFTSLLPLDSATVRVIGQDLWTVPAGVPVSVAPSATATFNLPVQTAMPDLNPVAPRGSEFRVNTTTTNSQYSPDIATDAAGNFVVVWTSTGSDGYPNIFAQRYNAAGVRQGSEFRVNGVPDTTNPHVAMDADGDFVITYEYVHAGSTYAASADYEVYAHRYNAAGVAQGGEFQVNTFAFSYQFEPSIAMDADGDFVIAWSNYGNGRNVRAQRFNSSGVRQGAEFIVNGSAHYDNQRPSVAMDDDGDFVVAWASGTSGYDRNVYNIAARRYSASGAALGDQFDVASVLTGAQDGAQAVMDADGDFLIAWGSWSANASGGMARRFNAAGVAQGTEFRTAGGWMSMDAAGDFMLSTRRQAQGTTLGGIFVQRYNAAGVLQGAEMRIDAQAANPGVAAIDMDDAGNFIAAWHGPDGGGPFTYPWQDTGIYARQFALPSSSTATISGTLFRDLNSNGVKNAAEPAVLGRSVFIDANDNRIRDASEQLVPASMSGSYSLAGLAPGTYVIRQVLPDGWTQPLASPGADPAQRITVVAGQHVTDADFGSAGTAYYYIHRTSPAYNIGGYLSVRAGPDANAPLIDERWINGLNQPLVIVAGDAGDDVVVIDYSTGGDPIPAGGFILDTRGGADRLEVVGDDKAQTLTLDAQAAILSGKRIAFSHLGEIRFDGRGGWDSVRLADGALLGLTFTAPQELASLELGYAGRAAIAPGAGAIVTQSLIMSPSARLDLGDNALVIDYASGGSSPIGSWNGSAYIGIAGLIQSGRSIGPWDGPGIVTTMSDAVSGITGLGLGEAADVLALGAGETAMWQGHRIDASAVIIRYTFAGDINLDGAVNGGDYGVLDNFVQVPGASGYFNGDLNYDGVINGGDYGIIDNAIQL